MKRKKVTQGVIIRLGDVHMKCSKCLHVRENEPYAVDYISTRDDWSEYKYTCWRCCRDAESTFLIKQKWPLAFTRLPYIWGWQLEWSPGIKELVDEHEKIQFSN